MVCLFAADRPEVDLRSTFEATSPVSRSGVGAHDSAYVDFYYGPPEWKADAERLKTPLPNLERVPVDQCAQLALLQ